MRDPRDRYSIPEEMRYHAPREVEVVAEHHCAANCAHLAQAQIRGIELGACAERERAECSRALLVTLAFCAGMLTAGLMHVGAAWVAGR